MPTIKLFKHSLLSSAIFASMGAFGHGLIESPPSRAYYCGVLTKPDQINDPSAQYPECADAFAETGTGGYSFMSF
ncbi:hypothetical protein N9J26_01655 [bacterium]|nr:hypothetical protein [bacterium]